METNKKSGLWLAVSLLVLAALCLHSYDVYFALQPDTNLFTINVWENIPEGSGRNKVHPGQDEFFFYAPKITAFRDDLTVIGDPFLKQESENRFFNMADALPILFFGSLAKAMNFDTMYLLSALFLSMIKFLLVFFIFRRIYNHVWLNVTAALVTIVNPSIFLFPFDAIAQMLKATDFFSLRTLMQVGGYLTPNYFTVRFYNGLFSLTILLITVILLERLIAENNRKKIVLYSLLIAANFYTYVMQLFLVCAGLMLIYAYLYWHSHNKKELIGKKILPSLLTFFGVGIPMIFTLLLHKFSFPDPEKFDLVQGVTIHNFTGTAYYLILFVIIFAIFAWVAHKKINGNTIRSQLTSLTHIPYGVPILALFISSVLLINLNVVIGFPSFDHFGKFAEIFAAFIFCMLATLLWKKRIKKKSKWNLGLKVFCVLLVALLLNHGIFLTVFHPTLAQDPAQTELYEFIASAQIREKEIMTLDVNENLMLMHNTPNYAFFPSAVGSLVSVDENTERLGFIIKTLKLNQTKVTYDLLSNRPNGIRTLYDYTFFGKYRKIHPTRQEFVDSMTPEQRQHVLSLIANPGEFSYDYVLISNTEKEYGFTGFGKDHALIFTNEKYEFYGHESSKES